MIELLLVDDHELVRAGIRRILDDTPGIRVIAEASTGEEAIQLVRDKQPDIVIMDVNMPGIGGLECTRKLVQTDPKLKVIVVTVHMDEPYPTKLLEAGATGYLTKSCAVDEIVLAITAVSEGERYLSADVAQQLALNKLVEVAKSEKDNATKTMLIWFIDEQVEEEASTDNIVQKLKMIGDSKNALFMLDSFLKKRE